jgi:hypothetical protein
MQQQRSNRRSTPNALDFVGREQHRLVSVCPAHDKLPRAAVGAGIRRGSEPLGNVFASHSLMIRKLSSGEYRLYSRKKDPKTGRKRNLGTFATREAAEKHEREVQYFKRTNTA